MKKKIKWVASVLLILPVFLATPALAGYYHHGGGGAAFFGFGVGLLSGFLLAPRPVYVAPAPVYAAPPPPVQYAPPGPVYPPPPAAAAPPETAQMATAPPPGNQSMCREWRMIENRTDYQWDAYYGRYRTVPVQRWGWVEIPCK
jgi:hypothetical protein